MHELILVCSLLSKVMYNSCFSYRACTCWDSKDIPVYMIIEATVDVPVHGGLYYKDFYHKSESHISLIL